MIFITAKILSPIYVHYICDDMNRMGIATLYLITDHTSFYERYGWDFLCMVQGEDDSDMSRMYIHNSSAQNV